MSHGWEEYLSLIEEASGLADREARARAEAEAAHAAEARRLQNELAVADRNLASLKDRNTRLQVGVRDLARATGVATTTPVTPDPLTLDQLAPALKSAEYDMTQLRETLERVKQQKEAAARPPAPRPAAPPPPAPAPAAPAPARSGGVPLPVFLGAALAATVLIVVVLVVVL